MDYLIETYFQWPVLPFSVLLCLVSLYWLMVIVGGLDLDLFDLDLDLDVDVDVDASPSVADWGLIGLKWFNIGEIPFMLWFSIMTLTGWLITMMFDRGLAEPSTQQIVIAVARTIGISLLITKFVTNPMRGMMTVKEPNTVEDMIGRTCSVVTLEATPEFGNAVCQVEQGAPLRLNIRTIDGSIPKDTIVEIVDYAPETGVYYVKSVGKSNT